MSTRKKATIVPHADGLREDLKDPKFAAEYLKACVEQSAADMPEVVLEAIRRLQTFVGWRGVAKEIGVDRTALYRMLSRRAVIPAFRKLHGDP